LQDVTTGVNQEFLVLFLTTVYEFAIISRFLKVQLKKYSGGSSGLDLWHCKGKKKIF
jgi:hypothetical protein